MAQLIVNDGQLNSDPNTVTITVPDSTIIDDDGDSFTEQQGDCNDTLATSGPAGGRSDVGLQDFAAQQE